jgi:hypothetical protein
VKITSFTDVVPWETLFTTELSTPSTGVKSEVTDFLPQRSPPVTLRLPAVDVEETAERSHDKWRDETLATPTR